MYAQSPRNIILAGDLGTREITSLTDYCGRLHSSGQADLHLDMEGVTTCDRAGLDGLTALAEGSSGLQVSVRGAHWGQFIGVLSAASVRELQALCDDVRVLLHPHAPSPDHPREGLTSGNAWRHRGPR